MQPIDLLSLYHHQNYNLNMLDKDDELLQDKHLVSVPISDVVYLYVT